MSEGIWMGHGDDVRAVSWSPSGGHISSGSDDGIILIRKADSGEVEVGPIETEQQWVYVLAYSPSGDRIASGRYSETICIWDSNTGELLVGPIKDLGAYVPSVVWSSDSSKLYSASDNFARVFDSFSGTELHRFVHNDYLNCIALSPKHNVLACVGYNGVPQLWDTESYQPLGKPFSSEDSVELFCVSFSRDGRYLAYGGYDENITLWMVQDIAPELPSSSSFLEVDATNSFARPGGDDIEDGHDDPYNNFFQPTHPFAAHTSSRPSQRRNLLSQLRLWNVFISSRHGLRASQTIPLQPRIKRTFFARHTGPQPVTVSAGRPRKCYWTVPLSWRIVLSEKERVKEKNGDANAHVCQSSATAAQPPRAAAPYSTPQGPQNLRAQPAMRPPHEDEFDYGCWGNFLHAVCCIPHARGVVPAVRPATS